MVLGIPMMLLAESVQEWPECQVLEDKGTNGGLMPLFLKKKKKKESKKEKRRKKEKKKNVENTGSVSSLCPGRAKRDTQLDHVPALGEKSKRGRDYT